MTTATTLPWKTVWLTGASTGIGRDVALQLARAGVKVAASARSAEALAKLSAEHVGISAFPLDVTDAAATKDVAAQVTATLGPIDLAIFNAGVWHPMSAAEYSSEKARDSMAVNYFGVTHCLAAVMPGMITRGSGHLAFVSSVAGYRGLPNSSGYSPSKAAVISLAECLKPDLARHGVKLTVINPGFVDTPMTSVNKFPMPFIIKSEDAARRIIAGLKTGRFEVAFPWQLVAMLKFARIVPYPLYFWLTRGAIPSEPTPPK
jgi:short-subunit dehydrogenase